MLHFRRTALFCVVVAGLFSLFPSRVEAITLDKSTYYVGDPVIAANGGGPLVLYNLDNSELVGQVPNYSSDWDVNYFGLSVTGHYSLMEFDIDVHPDCAGYNLSYTDCKASDGFVNEFAFNMVAPPSGGGGGGGTPTLSINKSQYIPGETVMVSCQSSNDSIQFYDITPGIDGVVTSGGSFVAAACVPGELLFDSTDGHSYAVIEVTGTQCVGQDYAPCAANTFLNVISEVHFTVSQAADAVVTNVVVMPRVTIVSPKDGDIFSNTGTINYSTLDALNVNLFYSDKLVNWNGSPIGSTNEVLIKSNVPKNGPYTLDTKSFVVGNLYRIIIDALGMGGLVGQAISGLFSIDLTAPTFIVKVDPPTTRGKDVTISVDASENLKEPPLVTVTQAGGKATPVVMKGQGSHYEGTYAVTKGYDGVAIIDVSGSDGAGNTSTKILSGGTFAIGINPPPAPNILSPQVNTVTITNTLSVTGTLRADTSVVLIVNGVDTYTASSSPNGAFTIDNIRLSKDTNHGLNVLSVAARDQAGLLSAAVPIQVKYNIAPTVAITLPIDKAVVSATTELAAQAGDENADPLLFSYQILPAADFDPKAAATSTKSEWVTIGAALPSANFSWDSTEVESGQYMLRVIADDGFTKIYSAPITFSIRNTLPFFRFEDGRKTVTNQSSVTIVGRALTPDILTPRPLIKTVEYSLDGGKRWKTILLTSGSNTPEALFSVKFTDLTEGTQSILWRAKDSRSLYGRTSHAILLDTTPPRAPIVNYPANNAFISNRDDENASKDGLQISVMGTAEPESTVTLQTGSAPEVTTKAKVDGSFVFYSVEVAHRGTNQFKLTAVDEAHNTSTVSIVNVVYDNPPTVSILTPKPFRGLTGKATVSWDISDVDNDPIRGVTLSYRRGQGVYTPLGIDPAKHSFVFDVSDFPETADYQLKLQASDGMATSTDLVNFSVDRTPPILNSLTLDTLVIGRGDTLRAHGTAEDALSGIEYVEYAVTEEAPTAFSTALLTSGFLQKNATFTLKYPMKITDGTYTVYARAVDAAGNVSPVLSHSIIVDTSPPSVGSFDVMAQGVRIIPDEKGVISLYKRMNTLFEVSLEGDADTASLLMGGTTIPLKKDIVSGLWQAAVDSGSIGMTPIALSATDKVHNAFIGMPLGSFNTIPYGLVTATPVNGNASALQGATIRVLVLDERTGNFAPFSREGVDAVTSGAEGEYSLALPQGTYELVVEKDGYHRVTQKVMFEQSRFVNESFSLEKYSGFWGFIRSIIDRVF